MDMIFSMFQIKVIFNQIIHQIITQNIQAHMFLKHIVQIQGGEIFDQETGNHIIDDFECMQYGDCEF